MIASHPGPVAPAPASLKHRLGAYAIDIGIAFAIPLMLLLMLLGAAYGLAAVLGTAAVSLPHLVPWLLIASCVGWALVYTAVQSGSGSIGQRVIGLRLSDAETGVDVRGGAASMPAPGAFAFAAEPATEYGAPVNSAPVLALLMWDDGSPMAVYERTVCGRNPPQEAGAVARALRDETLSLSKTHFEIDGDPAGAWIIDRFSTNGTHLVRDGERIGLAAGLPTTLRAGDRLEFGDRSAVVGVPA